MRPDVVIEAYWTNGAWKVDIDNRNRNSGFIYANNLADGLRQAVKTALRNYEFRRDKAGEVLDGPV